MLRFLSVRHLAVIEHVEVEFEPGLNILTGETGAGKSILIAAIDLLVGGRASADLVRTGEDQATIQAVFERPDGREVIVRREVSAQGRSRAFIDDVLATSTALKELGSTLVDLHGQHEHQTLLDPAGHIEQLDAFVARPDLVAGAAEHYDAWRAAAAAVSRSSLDEREKQARIDIARFHLQEIDKVGPERDEDGALQAERSVLSNVDRLSRLSNEAYAALYDAEHAALTSLATVWKRLGDLAALDTRFAPYLDARDGVKSALDDLAYFLRSYSRQLDASPERLQFVEDRLATLERLKRKHGPTLEEVLARRDQLREELAALGAGEERMAAFHQEERERRRLFVESAEVLSGLRREAAGRLSKALAESLRELAMPDCRIDLRLHRTDREDEWSSRGIDHVEFFLSPNPGEELRPLARIASGGELSRVMLALRALTMTGAEGQTLVFDEVDAGIGGAAAEAVGARLQELGRQYQVLCITHLPQVAARSGTHFHIAKQVRSGRTATSLVRLDDAGRELEIGRMIAGAAISSEVLASARKLLAEGAGESEARSKGESATKAKAKGRKRGA